MIALLLMAAAQSTATIEPGIYTAEQICRPYLGEQAVISSSPDVEDRCFVTHLKERTWEQVQGLLGKGYGIEVVATGENQWLLRLDEESASQLHREARETLSTVANAVESEAKAHLKRLGTARHEDLVFELNQLETALLPKATGYKHAEVLQFMEANRDDLKRSNLLSDYRGRSRWTALQEAVLSGRDAVRSRRPVEHLLPAPAYMERVKIGDLHSPSLRYGNVQSVRSITQFSWLSFLPHTEVRVLSAQGEEHLMEDAAVGIAPAKEVSEKVACDPAATLATLDQYPPADLPFESSRHPEPLGLGEQLVAWARQVDGEVIAEVNPLADLGGMPAYGKPKGRTLRAMIQAWIQNERFAELRDLPPSPEDRALSLDDAYYEYWKKSYSSFNSHINTLYSSLSAEVADDVLILSLPQQPLLSLLPLPQPQFWQLVLDGWSLDALRKYVQDVSPEENDQWLYAFGRSGDYSSTYSLPHLYPCLKALEAAGSQADDFWESLVRDGKAEATLSAGQARLIWQHLIRHREMYGELERDSGSGAEISASVHTSYPEQRGYVRFDFRSTIYDSGRASGTGAIYFSR